MSGFLESLQRKFFAILQIALFLTIVDAWHSYRPERICQTFVYNKTNCVCETSYNTFEYPLGNHVVNKIENGLLKVNFEQISLSKTYSIWILILAHFYGLVITFELILELIAQKLQ